MNDMEVIIFNKHNTDYFKPIEFMETDKFQKWKLTDCFVAIKNHIKSRNQKYVIERAGVEYFDIAFMPYAIIYNSPETVDDIYDCIGACCEVKSIDNNEDSEDSEDSEEKDPYLKISRLETRIDKLEDLLIDIASDIKSLKYRKH